MVIYTAIFGGYDTLKQPLVKQSANMVCFSDRQMEGGEWQVLVEEKPEDPCRAARKMKALPQDTFPVDDITIWIDGSMKLKVDIASMAIDLLGVGDIAAYHHNKRKCIYEEAEACIEFNKDDKSVIEDQMARYRNEGFPANFGLVSSGIVIRRNIPAVSEFNELWWKEIKYGSKRDQLSFDYCRWRTGIIWQRIPGSIYDEQLANLDCYHKVTE